MCTCERICASVYACVWVHVIVYVCFGCATCMSTTIGVSNHATNALQTNTHTHTRAQNVDKQQQQKQNLMTAPHCCWGEWVDIW